MSEPLPTGLSTFDDPSQLASFLQSLFEALPVSVTLLDGEGGVVFLNNRESNRAGIDSAPELVGRNYFRDVLRGSDTGKIAERYLNEVVKEGSAVSMPVTLSS